jgi:hypothetical protein
LPRFAFDLRSGRRRLRRITPGEARKNDEITTLRARLANKTRECTQLHRRLDAGATAIAALHHDNTVLRQEHDQRARLLARVPKSPLLKPRSHTLSGLGSPVRTEGSTVSPMTAAALSVCPRCGTGLRENAKFCDECGSALTGPDSHAEFKQVTVLFADVVHSMEIAAAVGAERLREIMAELMNRSAGVVLRYGGTIDKFTGDGIMALFGAPIALEDHAVRACLAALGIQEESQRLATDVDRRDGIALQLRVGLNSGQVSLRSSRTRRRWC